MEPGSEEPGDTDKAAADQKVEEMLQWSRAPKSPVTVAVLFARADSVYSFNGAGLRRAR